MIRNNPSPTAERILDVAQSLLQHQGFNGFSYQDIAEQVKIRKASIHYHFPTKNDLAVHLCARYTDQFIERLKRLNSRIAEPSLRLRELTLIYGRITKDKEKLCPMIMMATDAASLPAAARAHLQRFSTELEHWLTSVLEMGRQQGDLSFSGSAQAQARIFLAGLQGAMLLVRATGNRRQFQTITDDMLQQLQALHLHPRTSTADNVHPLKREAGAGY